MINNLFSVVYDRNYKIYNILGIKFKVRAKYIVKDLKEFAKIINVKLPVTIDSSTSYQRLLLQSFNVRTGDFVIDSGLENSENLISESLEKGATAIFCNAELKEKFPQKEVIFIKDPIKAVEKYATWRLKNCSAKRIAITGSIGKTTTTGLINSVLVNSFNTLTHYPNANSYNSVLRSIQNLTPSHDYWVQEVGALVPHYIECFAKFLKPDIVVLTNILDSHLASYVTRENIFTDKSSLEKYANKNANIIINYDDDILRNAKYTHNVVTVSLKDPSADYFAKDIKSGDDGLFFTAVCKNRKEIFVHLNLYGEFNAYNALYAIAVGELAGIELENLPSLLEQYYPSGMRHTRLSVGGFSIFADTYNANPESMLGCAKILEKLSMNKKGRKIFVSGQMNELGAQSAKMHKELGSQLANLDIDLILLYAGDVQYTYEGLKEAGFKNAILMNSREELDEWIRNNLTREDEIFFKSSHGDICLAITIDNVFGTTLSNLIESNYAYIVKENNYKFKIRKYGVVEVAEYQGYEKHIIIPSHYENRSITRIASAAFKEKNVESMIIPDSIQTICAEACFRCKNLKTLKLPKNLLYIDKHAFNTCTALEEIVIPENVIHIDYRAFYDCTSLRKVVIGEKVGFIGDLAFANTSASFEIICKKGSYAEQYAIDNNIKISYM